MKKLIRNYLFLILIAGFLILIDQLSKTWVRNNITLGQTYCFIENICEQVRFVHWYNTGVAFGLFQGNGTFFMVTSTLIAIAIIIFYAQVPTEDWLLRLALAFETGGAIGNLIDRYTIGHVTDFVSVGNFAVFNVADACINIGVAVMLLSVLLDEIKRRKSTDQEDIPSANELGPDSE